LIGFDEVLRQVSDGRRRRRDGQIDEVCRPEDRGRSLDEPIDDDLRRFRQHSRDELA
jgi:hypothetical protein